MVPQQTQAATNHDRLPPFNHPFVGRDVWALQLNAFGADFPPSRLPSRLGTAIPRSTRSQTADRDGVASPPPPPLPPPPPPSSFGPAPTPTPTPGGLGAAALGGGAPELDFAFGNALMADDLAFFGSLSSMFGNARALSPPAASASSFVAPRPQYATTPTTTATTMTGDPLQAYSSSQLEVPVPPAVPDPLAMEVQGGWNQDQDPGLGPWQWTPAPDGEL